MAYLEQTQKRSAVAPIKDQGIHHLTNGWKPFAASTSERSILDCFAEVVAHAPQALAVVHGPNAITFAELDARANQVAHGLLTQLGSGAEPVGHCFALGIDAFVALLGIVKAGKFYIALDRQWSDQQLQSTLTLSDPQFILTDDPARIIDGSLAPIKTTVCTMHRFTIEPATDPEIAVHAKDILYVVFTSGSMGIPKGALQTHRNMVHSARHGINLANYNSGDRIGLTTACTTTRGAIVTFYGLLSGATLVLFDQKEKTLEEFAAWLHAERITVLSLVPTLFRHWIAALQPDETYAHLRLLKFSGETCLQHDFVLFQRYFRPDAVLSNTYGTTETLLITEHCLTQGHQGTDAVIPVGYPIQEQTVYIVDENGRPLPVGEVGEIAVCSAYLSPGYWRNPTLTAARFLPGPEGGAQRIYLTGDLGRLRADQMLEHLGRKDSMVKIRGYRVELSAVEGALLEVPTIKAVAVTVWDDANGNKHIVAYLVPLATPPTVSALRAALQDLLPAYMIPTYFMMLDQFPLLPNGKIDRKSLPTLETCRPTLGTAYVPASNPLEAQLVEIWANLLGIHPIGVHDDFFELGGHSLTLLRLANELQTQFGQEVPLTTFLQGSTVAQLAAFLASYVSDGNGTDEVSDLPLELLTAADVDLIERYRFGRAVMPSPPTRKQRLLDQLFPYSARIHLFRLVGSNRSIQRRFFAGESETVEQFATALNISPEQINTVVTNHLMRSLCRQYCRGVLARTLSRSLTTRVVIFGQAHLDGAQQRGQGVILVDIHSLFVSGIHAIILKQLGYGDLMSYAGKMILQQNSALLQAFQRYFGTDEEALVIAKFLSLQMDLAQRKLKQGGIVWIAPDGGSGNQTHTFSVLGRERAFSTGFAELALQTGATVIPMRCVVTAAGKLQISFLAPLDAGSAPANREERIQGLMQQYVRFLAETWQLDPANVGLQHMRGFLRHRQQADAA